MDENLIKSLMIKKRNAINMKHIMLPQQELLVEL
jgi:hypothetical protein